MAGAVAEQRDDLVSANAGENEVEMPVVVEVAGHGGRGEGSVSVRKCCDLGSLEGGISLAEQDGDIGRAEIGGRTGADQVEVAVGVEIGEQAALADGGRKGDVLAGKVGASGLGEQGMEDHRAVGAGAVADVLAAIIVEIADEKAGGVAGGGKTAWVGEGFGTEAEAEKEQEKAGR